MKGRPPLVVYGSEYFILEFYFFFLIELRFL